MTLLNYFAAESYINLQFTRTAGVCAACGLFLIVYAITREKMMICPLVSGILITVYGYLYRHLEADVIFALFGVFGLYLILRVRKDAAGNEFKRVVRYLLVFALTIGCCYGCRLIDRHAYSRNEESAGYEEINDARAALMDYGFPKYEEHADLFKSLGITYNAYKLFSKWNFYDPDVFTLEKMNALIDVQKRKSVSLQTLKDFFEVYPYKWFENPMFYCFLTMTVLVLLYGKRDWKMWLTLVLLILALTGVFFIMYWNGRYNLQRVDSPIWLCACLILLFLTDPEKFFLPARFALTLVLVLLVLNQDNWRENWRHNTIKAAQKMAASANIAAQASQDTEHLYLSKVGLYTLSTGYGPLSLVPVGVGANTCSLGGWPAGSPSYCAVLKSYGIENPYRDCINNDKVYLIDNHIDWTMNYIHEYYDPDAQEEVIGTFGEDTMDRIVSKKTPQSNP